MSTAQDLIAAGDPAGALKLLQQQVRAMAHDAKLRVFLFQLLCITGDWKRALAQLQVCGELDTGALAMVATYREAIQCEAVREAVFAGKTLPHMFGRPEPWLALLAQALAADAQGDTAAAARLREQAFAEALATPGSLNGEPFDWIADADSRLGPVLEAVVNGRYVWVPFSALARIEIDAPTDLRDLVWVPARLRLANSGETVALIPTRYAGSGAEADAAIQMSRKTDWLAICDNQYRGLGQRVLTTSASEVGLLEVREVLLQGAPTAAPAGAT